MGSERLEEAVANEYGKEEGMNGSRSVPDLLFIPIGALIEPVSMARSRAKPDTFNFSRPRFEAGRDALSCPTRVSRLCSLLDRP